MYKFRTLLKKDWIINKKALMIPFWITAGFYAMILITVIIAYFRGELVMQGLTSGDSIPSMAMNYIANLSITILPGIMSILLTIMITQNALNEDMRKNYELFHRSQPVSLWERTGSKFLMGTAGSWIVLIIISVFNFIVLNTILAFYQQFIFGVALTGLIQSLIIYMKTGLVLGAMAFFASSIFKDKAFFKAIVALVSIQFLIMIVNALFAWRIPAPMKYFMEILQTTKFDMSELGNNDFLISGMIKERWHNILFNMKTVYQLLFSGIVFVVSSLIYNNKEIKID